MAQRFKGRLVAGGFSQRYRIDYNETYASILKFDTFRTLLAIAAILDLELHQADVKNAYLAGILEEHDLYMQLPEGLDEIEELGTLEGLICKLNKGLYGLKQAGRLWSKTFTKTLNSIGFCSIDRDGNVFINRERGVIIALYVDDMLFLGQLLKQINKAKAELARSYDIKDLGEAEYCLGIKIIRNRKKRTITIDQEVYIHSILRRFNMVDVRTVKTPIESTPTAGSRLQPARFY